MSPFRTILFGADFSATSREAFLTACALAAETKTRLFVLHVAERMPPGGWPLAFGDPAVVAHLPDVELFDPAEIMARLKASYAPGRPIDVTYMVREGEPVAEVLRAAEDLGADLIAMGTHGRTGLLRALAGSVAEAVLRKARCPVLTFRASSGRPVEPGTGNVLFATDFSGDSLGGLIVARQVARDLGTGLVILHVELPAEEIPGVVPMPVDLRADREALEALRARCEGPDLKGPVETVLARGDVDVEILRVARDLGCGLVVMGTHGRTGLSRLLMGSVAEAVLRHADRPVLAVRVPSPRPAWAVPTPAEAVLL